MGAVVKCYFELDVNPIIKLCFEEDECVGHYSNRYKSHRKVFKRP